jgi:hypothetical protein
MKIYKWYFGASEGICRSTEAAMKEKSMQYARSCLAKGIPLSEIKACYTPVQMRQPPVSM